MSRSGSLGWMNCEQCGRLTRVAKVRRSGCTACVGAACEERHVTVDSARTKAAALARAEEARQSGALQCRDCLAFLPLAEFNKGDPNTVGRLGLSSYCRACARVRRLNRTRAGMRAAVAPTEVRP